MIKWKWRLGSVLLQLIIISKKTFPQTRTNQQVAIKLKKTIYYKLSFCLSYIK